MLPSINTNAGRCLTVPISHFRTPKLCSQHKYYFIIDCITRHTSFARKLCGSRKLRGASSLIKLALTKWTTSHNISIFRTVVWQTKVCTFRNYARHIIWHMPHFGQFGWEVSFTHTHTAKTGNMERTLLALINFDIKQAAKWMPLVWNSC